MKAYSIALLACLTMLPWSSFCQTNEPGEPEGTALFLNIVRTGNEVFAYTGLLEFFLSEQNERIGLLELENQLKSRIISEREEQLQLKVGIIAEYLAIQDNLVEENNTLRHHLKAAKNNKIIAVASAATGAMLVMIDNTITRIIGGGLLCVSIYFTLKR